MRGVWWSAFALLLVAVVVGALRTAQVEGVSRGSRRHSSPNRNVTSINSSVVSPSPRTRDLGTREEFSPRNISRTRSKSRSSEVLTSTTEIPYKKSERNEQLNSRRQIPRTRNKLTINEANFDTTVNRGIQSRGRSRSPVVNRRLNTKTTSIPTSTIITTTVTQASITSSTAPSRKEFTDPAFNDISKTSPKEITDPRSQFKRRSSTEHLIEPTTMRTRNRINTRSNIQALDLEVSGTANALTTVLKEATTARTDDVRISRKLRFKSRALEVDSNLTGDGITDSNEVKSSHTRENNTSQKEPRLVSRPTTEKLIRQTTERVSKTSTKTTKVVKRPISRGKVKLPLVTIKPKVSDEVHENDNYPETFKALIQARNASTQASSPPGESLSVKESQKVYNTYTSSQTILTAPDSEKQTWLRSKINLEENKNDTDFNNIKEEETTTIPKLPTFKSSEYRLRGSYSSRNKKSNSFSSSTIRPTSLSLVTHRPYKFSRNHTNLTTEASNVDNIKNYKGIENNNNLYKKRSSLYSRRNITKSSNVLTEVPKIVTLDRSDKIPSFKPKSILPRTSYYSRLRNNSTTKKISTIEPIIETTTNTVIRGEEKAESTAELPLIYTNTNILTTEKNLHIANEIRNDTSNFVITVNSKESIENGTGNEVISKREEIEIKPLLNIVSTTQKYHATYKDISGDVSLQSSSKVTLTPPIRNIQTRKYGRKPMKRTEEVSNITAKPNARTLRKYSNIFSKTTEPSSNGIIDEPEKIKNKFSSKYRASYIDKPFYKPTVPTITPSTAWLKFFVTDHLLSKSVEEPNWFEDEDFSDVTTEPMSRQNTTSPTCHETAFQLVEEEEIQLGPDMNAISITKSRSPLTSADLRLSESLVKSLQVMNVEASQHSPSVTVSIFDALAEILTSTPKPRLSSTTEVLQFQTTNNDVKQTFSGVSNSNNVNNVKDSTSQDALMSTDFVTTVAKTVQTTEPSTQNVFNRMPVEGNVTPTQIVEAGKLSTVNTPQTSRTPTSPPTTPLSARRPFAIKVLYTDIEKTTDRMTTTNQPMTDSSTMVYNTVSDLILSNNNIVSSELTSMLSNNIKNIIQNMDDDSKARLSVDMVKLLNTLIPKLNKPLTAQDDYDSPPNTTPYSLEDIHDTANIDINNKNMLSMSVENILQNVENNKNVNSTKINIVTTSFSTPIVNSPIAPEIINSTTMFVSGNETISTTRESVEVKKKTFTRQSENLDYSDGTFSTTTASNVDKALNSPDINMVNESSESSSSSGSITKPPFPAPFLTNFKLSDFNDSEIINSEKTSQTVSLRSLQVQDLETIDNIKDPSQLSRLQLWILSKKARVLKMIEDIIRTHNDEISNASLTELVNDTNESNIFISSRLSNIINTMNMTTTTNTPDISNENFSTSTMTNTEPTISSLGPFRSSQDIVDDTASTNGYLITTPQQISYTVSQSTESSAFKLTDDVAATSSLIPTEAIETTTLVPSTNIPDTADTNPPTTDSFSNTETTTSSNVEAMTQFGASENPIEKTTVSGTDTTAVLPKNEIFSSNVNNIKIDADVKASIPKKDYVIFGILPNNTVVRKDPNDNVLETLTESSPYIIYGVLPNNTIIRKFPNGTRVPRIMQKIDILPISPWSLRNPYSPIHNIPAIVRPQSNPIRVSTNTVISKDTSNNEKESQLTINTVNNLQTTISSSALNIKDSSLFGITTSTNKPTAEKSTASHVLSLRTTTMLPSVDEILLNSISSATKEEMVISLMTSSTSEPRILTLDIDPETKQIRTEKPEDGNGNAVFKFIPIDEIMVSPQESNVLKLASTKNPKSTTMKEIQSTVFDTTTQVTREIPFEATNMPSELPIIMNTEFTTEVLQKLLPTATTTESATSFPVTTTTSEPSTLTSSTVTQTISTVASSELASDTPTTVAPTYSTVTMSPSSSIISQTSNMKSIFETAASNQKDAALLQSLLQEIGRSPKSLNSVSNTNLTPNSQLNDNAKLLQAILSGNTLNLGSTKNVQQTTTIRSIEDDLRQFEEDTKLLKALLLATGRNPAELNLPNLDSIKAMTSSTATATDRPTVTTTMITTTPTTTTPTTTTAPTTTSTTTTSTTTTPTTTTSTTTTPTTTTPTTTTPTTTTPATTTTTTTTTNIPLTSTTASYQTDMSSTSNINDDIRRLQEDTKLLQALLQATGNRNIGSLPIISGLTSNIRVASNPLTTSIESNPTTPFNSRPVYTTRPSPVFNNDFTTGTVTVSTLQPQRSSTEDIGISTTFRPFPERTSTSQSFDSAQSATRRPKAVKFHITTDIPSTSTFSDEEDLLFLKNLKSVLSSKTNEGDPETALANRVIALAVERSLNEIQSPTTLKPPTTQRLTTSSTTTTSTTTPATTTTMQTTTSASTLNTPSLDDDIKQFEEDTKLLQALLKATGQDPSKFNIPTLNTIRPTADLKSQNVAVITTAKPYGAKIAVKDDLKSEQDDAKLLQTLIKLQDAQETTTQRGKIAFTGQSSDEALKKLLQQAQPAGMVSEATKSSISLSTEYGNSNDALLAALLKEQGFGPTTASSIDEQLRLAALLNQVVVTPKARRTTTPPPPPPAPRRPLLDGLAWLWQQWRETAPEPGQPRPNRRPEQVSPANSPAAATSSRGNWFGSGPFVGNAEERPTSNRIPLEPPSVVTSEQGPGRGQLVSAAINVTRAFSQFLGAAIQGAAQTVQNVFRAGQKVASDAYTNGSG